MKKTVFFEDPFWVGAFERIQDGTVGSSLSDDTFVSRLAMEGNRIAGTSGMSLVEKPPYFACPSGKLGLLSVMYANPAYRLYVRQEAMAADQSTSPLQT